GRPTGKSGPITLTHVDHEHTHRPRIRDGMVDADVQGILTRRDLAYVQLGHRTRREVEGAIADRADPGEDRLVVPLPQQWIRHAGREARARAVEDDRRTPVDIADRGAQQFMSRRDLLPRLLESPQ